MTNLLLGYMDAVKKAMKKKPEKLVIQTEEDTSIIADVSGDGDLLLAEVSVDSEASDQYEYGLAIPHKSLAEFCNYINKLLEK